MVTGHSGIYIYIYNYIILHIYIYTHTRYDYIIWLNSKDPTTPSHAVIIIDGFHSGLILGHVCMIIFLYATCKYASEYKYKYIYIHLHI